MTLPNNRAVTSIDREVAARLRALRLERSLTLEQLAHKTGVSYQQILKYERADCRISVSRLFELAVALDVPLARFFEGITLATEAAHA